MGARAFVVVDLGYGDAGKGSVVDFLVRRYGAGAVVRFNGGPQAAHNVVLPDGRHHTFSTWGSGTFAGAPTYLAEPVLVNPMVAFPEAENLVRLGVADPWSMLQVSHECKLIMPWHVAANRLREQARGDGRHGSCGHGIGACMEDAVRGDYIRTHALYTSHAELAGIFRRSRDFKVEALRQELGTEAFINTPEGVDDMLFGSIDKVVALYRAFWELVRPNDHMLMRSPNLVFEGAQGVLIDERWGAAPFHTWSDCTFGNAMRVLDRESFMGQVVRIGVTRTYMVRHGPGPLPTEDCNIWYRAPELHNEYNDWQRWFRWGYADFQQLAYAIKACGGVHALALTHLDKGMPGGRWRDTAGVDHQGEPEDPVALFEEQLGVPVAIASYGPTYDDKVVRA